MKEPQAEILDNLNPQQLLAVTYPNQSALILAGAGSGKTRVLTSRILWLLYTHQAAIQNIIAVTFTNKAAKEMRTRIESKLSYPINEMWLGTFHSLCHRFLRRYHTEANLTRHFQIIDSQDQLSIIKRLMKNSVNIDSSITPKELLNYINNSKEKGLRSNHPALYENPRYYSFNQLYQSYEQICQTENLVDFTELLLRCLETLQKYPLLRQNFQNRFSHILVDEFQDTNDLQYQWLRLLSNKSTTIFAVGDDDQSIYSFRGANVKNMQHLIRDFNITDPIKLEQNYRSTQTILSTANAIIAKNQNRIGKNLYSTLEKGELIKMIRTYTELEESLFLVEEIKTLHNNGLDYNQIAVLYRNNAQSRAIEQALFNYNIPYKVHGGLRFYEREEIKHALAYLRLMVNPDDDNSLLRIINLPNRGIGGKSIESLQTSAKAQQCSLWEIIATIQTKNSKLQTFYNLIIQLRQKIDILPLAELIDATINSSGLINYYQNKKGDFQNKIDNLKELINAALSFTYQESFFEIESEKSKVTNNEVLLAFLSNASLEAGERESKIHSKQQHDFVQLMTIHSAKGLEFNTVFLIAVEEGLFPSEYNLNNIDGLEEERRLMYVAITRAQKQLFISSVCERLHNGKKNASVISRFIEEVPQDFIHHLSSQYAYQNSAELQNSAYRKQQFYASISKTTLQHGEFQLGDNLQHPKFGTGVVIAIQAKNNSSILTINFGSGGIKILDSAIAKLAKI